MRLKAVIRAHKANVSIGNWHQGGVSKSLFPLQKSGKSSLNFRGAFNLCGIEFTAAGSSFRVLIAVDLNKQEYYAHLGKAMGNDTQMIASYEFHSTHGGWHAHSACDHIENIPPGRYKGPWKRRIPKDMLTDRSIEFGVKSLPDALRLACEVFGIAPDATLPKGQLPLV